MNVNTLHDHFIHKLFDYVCDNNPDLLVRLEDDFAITTYLTDKVAVIKETIQQYCTKPLYLLEEICMDLLTKDLRPSKYLYITHVLEYEFSSAYLYLKRVGTIKYEVINLISYCDHVFDSMNFSEATEDSRLLYYGIAGAVSQYFDQSVSETETSEQWDTTVSKS